MSLSSEGKLKCFVCDNDKASFICVSCICKGDFTSSKVDHGSNLTVKPSNLCYNTCGPTTGLEKFSEKKAKLWILEEEHRQINEKYKTLLAESKQLEAIEQSVAEYEIKIAAFKKMIHERKVEKAKSEEYSKRLTKTKEMLLSNQDKFKADMEVTHKTVAQITTKMKLADSECEKLFIKIKKATKESILQLKEYIFPIQVINNCATSTVDTSVDESCSDSVGPQSYGADAVSGAESFSTCCQPSMGSWANVEPNNQKYHIVESWIPRDSVARAYCQWSSQMKEHLKINPADGEVKTRDNDAYRVSAALAYITQLLTVASHYMDTRFPKKLNFVEFYTKYSDSGNEVLLSDEELLHRVAKLNTNLIYLCLSQDVRPNFLEPTMTGQNLNLLLNPNTSDLGRIGPVYIDSELYRKVEEALYPDYALVDQQDDQEFLATDNYDEEFIGSDWESVQPTATPYMELYSSQQTASMTSGIMSSIAETALNAVTSFIRKK